MYRDLLEVVEIMGRVLLGVISVTGAFMWSGWALWGDARMGVFILLGVVVGGIVAWAIIAPILRWWRRGNAMTLDKALSILRKR